MNRSIVVATIGFGGMCLLLGCEQEHGCRELCAREAQCRQDLGVIATDEDACTADCQALADDDPDYAEAVSERAACLAEADCETVAFGGCVPDGE